jgi:hypothetical protein
MVERIAEPKNIYRINAARPDVLVSEYYSTAYSHVAPFGPSAKYEEFIRRQTALA